MSIRDEVHSVLDDVNAEWEELDELFRRLQVPVRAYADVDDMLTEADHNSDTVVKRGLCWTKEGGKWQVAVYVSYPELEQIHITPMREVNAADRIEWLNHAPLLLHELKQQCHAFVEHGRKWIEEARAGLSLITCEVEMMIENDEMKSR